LHVNEEKRKEDKISEKQTKQKKQMNRVQSLSNFY